MRLLTLEMYGNADTDTKWYEMAALNNTGIMQTSVAFSKADWNNRQV
jgi:hypothetical protein